MPGFRSPSNALLPCEPCHVSDAVLNLIGGLTSGSLNSFAGVAFCRGCSRPPHPAPTTTDRAARVAASHRIGPVLLPSLIFLPLFIERRSPGRTLGSARRRG